MTNEELAKMIYSGHDELINVLYNQNLRLIYKFAISYKNKYSERLNKCGVEIGDMVNESYFAIPYAVQAFCKSDTGYKFTAFLKFPVKKCFDKLVGLGKKEPLDIAVSLETPNPKDDSLTLGDSIEDDNAEFEERIANNMLNVFESVKEALKDYPLYYDVVYMKYALNMTQLAISQKLGCNDSYIHAILYKAMRLLRHPKSKIIKQYREEILGADIISSSYQRGGLNRFNNTWESSVEWAVKNLSKENGKE